MKAVEYRLPKEFDKSFIVFRERGCFFPVPWHYHPEYELVLVTKSTGRRMVGDHIGYFNAGDLVLMGPMLPHVWVNDTKYISGNNKDAADAIVVQFVEDFLGEKFLQLPEIEAFKKILKLSAYGLEIKGDTRNSINELMKRMLTASGLQRLSMLFAIFDLLSATKEYQLLASPAFINNTTLHESDRFNNITEYIMRNFDSEISLNEVAAVANMATTTFCNFFKEHYRVTFMEYVTEIRIGHACKLLGDPDKNIVEAAYESGFNNLANFNRQFKKLKNMTPTEYRKMLEI
ncbi:MAG: AraC family transcriptional regulator [Chitinophagaceae bacterium]|nr:AraC family transcriptional regulator [Chitinophagaceae bacterium]MCW5926810.1 AraC family transcriptional regulator [Chitinophagaceae bacterium]